MAGAPAAGASGLGGGQRLPLPHVSGTRRNRQYPVRTNQVFCENLRRYLDGQPLINVTTKQRGY